MFFLSRKLFYVFAAVLLMNQAEVFAQSAEVRQISNSCFRPCDVAAKSGQTVEVILPDATSILMAPDSQARVSRTAKGGVLVKIAKGSLRVAGGSRNAALPIRVTTPHATLSITEASIFVSVESKRTRTHLLNGDALIVTAGTSTRRIYRPGYQATAGVARVSTPRRMVAKQIVSDLLSISPSLTTGQRPRVTF